MTTIWQQKPAITKSSLCTWASLSREPVCNSGHSHICSSDGVEATDIWFLADWLVRTCVGSQVADDYWKSSISRTEIWCVIGSSPLSLTSITFDTKLRCNVVKLTTSPGDETDSDASKCRIFPTVCRKIFYHLRDTSGSYRYEIQLIFYIIRNNYIWFSLGRIIHIYVANSRRIHWALRIWV
jgi:hypothetical protein